ncbi:peptidoglycan/xylan/chitin deacetylase (PgdA/CDA1 family) [Nocardia ignorata]|uniref:Peptidoglycan/xylan/chitin deacetylase (PgdA/CDA1 family) n=2 Tax=Nocardia ignorata TaxID=145285 RepID=A0A4R6PXM5_NOCIG|nr:peptidoglycan/xylan/chitin deacetylase (PgdA/CDA1 family) [Nocardia ignorata]
MDRRRMLTLLAAGTVGALAGCASAGGETAPVGEAVVPVPPPPAPTPKQPVLPPPPSGPKSIIGPETITALPGQGTSMALTVDDGASPEVVGAYIKWAQDTGARFTFFVTGSFEAWTIHRDALRPLVDSGQIQLGNHTWSHEALTKIGADGVVDQLSRTKTFLHNNFGVDGTPFYRPPFGYHNATVDKIAADLGYTVPTMWYGSLSDSGLITEEYLMECARKYFAAQTIIIGHANFPPVTHCYEQLVDIIRERNLSLVTLNDVLEVRS